MEDFQYNTTHSHDFRNLLKHSMTVADKNQNLLRHYKLYAFKAKNLQGNSWKRLIHF